MPNEYEPLILPSTLMCGWCEGIGTRVDSECAEYECAGCKGTGMIQREVEDNA